MQKIKFSICIPNYNYAHYLAITIQSVLDQNYGNFEIIVADNASTDNSLEVVKSFQDDRVHLVENRYNVGFAPNLDKATEPSTGDYMILLSSDDIMKPSALEEYAKVIERYNGLENSLVIMSACDVIDSEGQVIGSKKSQTGDVTTFLDKTNSRDIENKEKNIEQYNGLHILKGLLLASFQPAGQFLTTCYSRKLYQVLEGYHSIMSVLPDAHFSHKLLFENPKVIYLHKSLFAYRVHAANNLHQEETMSNIKNLTDNYLFTQLYSKQQLAKTGLSGIDLKKAFIRTHCLKKAYYGMLRGKFKKWQHHYHFGLASYPKLMLKEPIFYFVCCGRFLIPLFRMLYWMKKELEKKNV